MGAQYEIWLSDDAGIRLRLLDDHAGLELARRVNAVGAFTLTLDGSFDADLMAVDRRLEVWRAPEEGMALRLLFVGFVRRWKWWTSAAGLTALVVQGYDQNELLRRRIVAYKANSAQAAKDDQADDMMKAIVRENLGASATDADRNLTALGVTVQADSGAGPTIEKKFAYRNVMDVLAEIADVAATAGTDVFFDLVPVSRTALEFQTFTGQRGADHTWPGGTPPVVFSLEFGNLEQPSLEMDYSGEVNYVYGAGQGEGDARVLVEVEDATREAASAWNRREGFKDARNDEAADQVTADAQEALEEGMPALRFNGQVAQTDQCRFGIEWEMGDRVTAVYQGLTVDTMIAAVNVKLDGNGKETVTAKLEA